MLRARNPASVSEGHWPYAPQANLAWLHRASHSACECSCSSLAPKFGSLSVSFCVRCSPFHPSCLYLSLGIPHFLPLCISVSDNRISFPLRSHRFFSDCQSSNNGTSLPLALSRGLKDFCLISSMQTTHRTFRVSHPDSPKRTREGS